MPLIVVLNRQSVWVLPRIRSDTTKECFILIIRFLLWSAGCTISTHDLLSDDRSRDRMEGLVFPLGWPINPGVSRTPCEHVVRSLFGNKIDYLGVENLQTRTAVNK